MSTKRFRFCTSWLSGWTHWRNIALRFARFFFSLWCEWHFFDAISLFHLFVFSFSISWKTLECLENIKKSRSFEEKFFFFMVSYYIQQFLSDTETTACCLPGEISNFYLKQVHENNVVSFSIPQECQKCKKRCRVCGRCIRLPQNWYQNEFR